MEHKIWNPRWECATREEKNEIQLERLKKIAAYCYERVPFYKQKFDEIGLRPEHIKTLSDVKHLPFTTADDLKNNYPFGLFAVPKKEIVRIHGSSGTTGKPKIVGYTKNDLETDCSPGVLGSITAWKEWAPWWCRFLQAILTGR